MRDIHLYKGDIFYFTDSPLDKKEAYVYIPDGALAVENGEIQETGPYNEIHSKYTNAQVVDYSGLLIMPGLIDAHIHYPQTEIIGMYGRQLLDWLNEYTFPAEMDFNSHRHAEEIAEFFVRELFRNGTTSCAAYSTVHASSADILFQTASRYNMRIITGKTLMDRNAPQQLTDTLEQGIKESRELIEKWHNKGRNLYAITPRFAITSSPQQLRIAARLHSMFPDTYIQTHLSENKNEISTTLMVHKGHSDYLEVYEKAGLITKRTLLGHCIHLSTDEIERLAKSEAIVVHCPTSNLFLGSGLFEMKRLNEAKVKTVLATDVGAGTSFSMFKTMGAAYKIMQTTGYAMPVLESFYKSTLGTARALDLDDKIGSFKKGNEADFIVVDITATPIQKIRSAYLKRHDKWTIENQLFGLQTQGDDRNIIATYLMGNKVYDLKNSHFVTHFGKAD